MEYKWNVLAAHPQRPITYMVKSSCFAIKLVQWWWENDGGAKRKEVLGKEMRQLCENDMQFFCLLLII